MILRTPVSVHRSTIVPVVRVRFEKPLSILFLVEFRAYDKSQFLVIKILLNPRTRVCVYTLVYALRRRLLLKHLCEKFPVKLCAWLLKNTRVRSPLYRIRASWFPNGAKLIPRQSLWPGERKKKKRNYYHRQRWRKIVRNRSLRSYSFLLFFFFSAFWIIIFQIYYLKIKKLSFETTCIFLSRVKNYFKSITTKMTGAPRLLFPVSLDLTKSSQMYFIRI